MTAIRQLVFIFSVYLFQKVMASGESSSQVEAEIIVADLSPSAQSNQESVPSTTEATLSPFLLRLHLIRHGETDANVQNIVLGQGDSPLTDQGLTVARIAAANNDINGKRLRYWRTYCSDLYRAHRTARIVLGLETDRRDGRTEEENFPEVDLIVDGRLRELAKGAREGFDKSVTYEEAMAARLNRAQNDQSNSAMQVPLLESIEDAWDRVQSWIDSLIKEAFADYYNSRRFRENDSAKECVLEETPKSSKTPKIYNVFALSHSALIRTMIHQMVDSQLPPDYSKTDEGSLKIPNLSRTIIDVQPYIEKNGGDEGHNLSNDEKIWGIESKWTASLVKLTDVSHLGEKAGHGPPYL
ncbi:hypothetical protein ACHAXS_011512 [Conticribra weissflogii]